ncbi:TrbI/VirB10 family protein [Lysobacter niabensis]|uniref:TrbI/VirB10 family protein n=1 Tax=Agrilutibacter niabensis TaxID=380628 RepID=UPI00360C611C
MNPNMPSQHGRNDGVADYYQDGTGGHPAGNPYYTQQQASDGVPDLDASAPLLRSNEAQRLNRKAMVFLAGIVALLVIAAIWMFRSAAAGGNEKPRVAEQEVRIPELPKATVIEEAMGESAASDLPPLPMTDMAAVPAQPQLTPTTPTPMPLPHADAPGEVPREPSLMERRMANMAGAESPHASALGGPPGMMPPDAYTQAMLNLASQGNGQPAAAKPMRAIPASAQPLTDPDTLLLRGTYIRCVMETRIVTDVAGFTSCVVTEPVYSVNGRRLLLPKGSKISGTYENDNISGPRVAVVWDRITTPTGVDINMASPGVDNLGGAGNPGGYDGHWASRISSALMISLISDAFKYAGAKHGPETTTVTNAGNEVIQPYESNTARAMERLAYQAADRSMNRPATVTINQGAVVSVYVAKDVDFSSVLR